MRPNSNRSPCGTKFRLAASDRVSGSTARHCSRGSTAIGAVSRQSSRRTQRCGGKRWRALSRCRRRRAYRSRRKSWNRPKARAWSLLRLRPRRVRARPPPPAPRCRSARRPPSRRRKTCSCAARRCCSVVEKSRSISDNSIPAATTRSLPRWEMPSDLRRSGKRLSRRCSPRVSASSTKPKRS